MAKYIKQEMNDLNGTGKKQAYYRMQIYHHLNHSQFVEMCTRHGGWQRSTIVGAVAHVCRELALQLAEGNSVTIDGLGTFRPKLGVVPYMEKDNFEEGESNRNVQSIEVTGINFRADKDLITEIGEHIHLERGRESRLHQSNYTPEQRAEMARQYLTENPIMRVRDYVQLTGLSRTKAAEELLALSQNPQSGITSRGRSSAKVYLLYRKENETV